jgi:hypothetical protein
LASGRGEEGEEESDRRPSNPSVPSHRFGNRPRQVPSPSWRGSCYHP